MILFNCLDWPLQLQNASASVELGFGRDLSRRPDMNTMMRPASAARFTDTMVIMSPSTDDGGPYGFVIHLSAENKRRRGALLLMISCSTLFTFSAWKSTEVNSEQPTVDSERDLGLSHADPGHDGLAHILAGICLAH